MPDQTEITSIALREEVESLRETLEIASERMTAIEERFVLVEAATAKIPAIEARLSRVDRMLLEMQGDMRRFEKSANGHSQSIEAKLDDLKALLVGAKGGR